MRSVFKRSGIMKTSTTYFSQNEAENVKTYPTVPQYFFQIKGVEMSLSSACEKNHTCFITNIDVICKHKQI